LLLAFPKELKRWATISALQTADAFLGRCSTQLFQIGFKSRTNSGSTCVFETDSGASKISTGLPGNSIRKSGVIGGSFFRSSGGSANHRSEDIHDASGERFEPSGRQKITDESNVTPPNCFYHARN
jgi:hypothetical protein